MGNVTSMIIIGLSSLGFIVYLGFMLIKALKIYVNKNPK